MTALSPFTRPRRGAQALTLSLLLGIASLLAWRGTIAARSIAKPALEARLLALAKNAPIAAQGLREVRVRLGSGEAGRELAVRYLFLPSTAVPRRDRPPLPPIVFLHDTPGTLCEWVGVIYGDSGADLPYDGLREATNAIYAVELPGHGFAPELEAAPSPEDLEAVVAGSLRALRLEGAILVGAGWGGALAARVALAAPELVGKLVLVAPRLLPGEPAVAAALAIGEDDHEEVDEGAARAALEVLCYRRPTAEEVAENELVRRNAQNAQTAARLAAAEREGGGEALLARLAAIRQPTLLLWGGIDRVQPVESCGRRIQAAIPGAVLSTIEGCGHRPHVEQPAAVIRCIDGFR